MVSLRQQNIRAILDLQMLPSDPIDTINIFMQEQAEKNNIKYTIIPFRDDEFNTDLDQVFTSGHTFLADMEQQFPAKKDTILVKCAAGISRSPSMLINHFCMSRRMSYVDALNYIRERERYTITFGSSPNPYFANYLKRRFPDATYIGG